MKNLILFLIFICLNGSIFAREITFLPAYVLGEEPPALKKKDNLSSGISELIGYYAHENFLVEVSDPEKVKSYISELAEEMDRKPSRSLLNGVCEEFSSDFIVKTEINFEGNISILTEVYNCRGKVVTSEESIFKDNFYLAMENHTKKTLRFLVSKNKTNSVNDFSANEEILFVLDLSGALAGEINSVVNYIDSITGSKGLSLGALLVSENSIRVIQPSFKHNKLKEELAKIKQGGDVRLDRITQGLLKMKAELGNAKISKKKLILVTDAKSNSKNDYGYLSAIQSFKEMGYNTYIITGSYFDYKSMSLHKKAAKSGGNNLQQITHFQRVGTSQGYRVIYLNDRKIYFDDSSDVNPKNLDLKELAVLDEGSILSKYEFPHPGNMSEIYSEVQGQRLIEKQSVSSNISQVLERIIQNKSELASGTGSKILMKSGSVSFWLTLATHDESLENKEVSFKVNFVKDNYSSNGFANIPKETFLYKDNVPKLLVLEPAQIRNYLKTNNSFTCFVSGKILEIK